MGLALLAAIGFGSFFAGIDRAEETADVAWVLLAARTADVALLVVAALVFRPRIPTAPAALGAIAAVGALDLLANLLFVLAAGRGLLSVVGVLGSLYPAVTVMLARIVLHERPSRTQNAGVLITLAGVVALAAGNLGHRNRATPSGFVRRTDCDRRLLSHRAAVASKRPKARSTWCHDSSSSRCSRCSPPRCSPLPPRRPPARR